MAKKSGGSLEASNNLEITAITFWVLMASVRAMNFETAACRLCIGVVVDWLLEYFGKPAKRVWEGLTFVQWALRLFGMRPTMLVAARGWRKLGPRESLLK